MRGIALRASWIACSVLALAFGCTEEPGGDRASAPVAPAARPGADAKAPPAKRAPAPEAPPVDHAALAKEILKATGVKGGLVAHLGCTDGKLTAALRANDSYIVHGLAADAEDVATAREHIRSLGCYGTVSVARQTGDRLPYANDLVDLLVVENAGRVADAEFMRVLVPRGVAYVREGAAWRKAVKAVPGEIDEWTHFLHDASNNAVAKDSRVGPPRRLQWTAGPAWCRSHEYISSFSAMVTAGGRVIYVNDFGQPGVTDSRLPQRWELVARGAFNGVHLWRRPLPRWRGDEWKSTAMRGRPRSVPRRMVIDGDKLFITLSHLGGLSVLDAATGETLCEIEGTECTQEVVMSGRTLVLRLAGATIDGKRTEPGIVAVDADRGSVIWRSQTSRFLEQSLCAAEGRVVYSGGNETVCLGLADGNELWRAATFEAKAEPKPDAKGKQKKRRRGGQQTFVLHGDVVLVTDGSRLLAREARTGKLLWSVKTGGRSMRGHDLFVAQGLAWHAGPGGIAGYDLATGKVARSVDASSVQSVGHHLRCYRAKATERYLITQFRGAEFVSLGDAPHVNNDWTRGPCRHGILPANGLFYAPPHQCFCYPGIMMLGLNAYSTAPDAELEGIGGVVLGERLERGLAYGEVASAAAGDDSDWPMYRHDARRTGASSGEVDAKVASRWQVEFGGRLTPPVVAGESVFVATKDDHTLHALSRSDGRELWRFAADARIDSPPTVHGGNVLFGCADGRVYCLRASDGALAWRFRAAPAERLVVDGGQLESAWRVHGSVLVEGGVAYCTAGRSTFLDGGIWVLGLDPATGKVLHERRLNTLWATRPDAQGKPFSTAFHIEGTRSDLLVAEGGYIYLGQVRLSLGLEPRPAPYVKHSDDEKTTGLDIKDKPYVAPNAYLARGYEKAAALGVKRGHMGDREMGLRLFTTGGFLEDSWHNRPFWMYGTAWPGFQMGHIAPKAGQIIAIGPETTYAVQAYPGRNIHSPMFKPGNKGYLLLADRNDNDPLLHHESWARDKGMGYTRKAPPVWHAWVPIRMRAMVLAGRTLFVAGPPDVVPEDDPYAALDGRKGAVLRAFAAADGAGLAEIKLDSAPVFDGLIAAGGRLYMSDRAGRVTCLAGD
ncbi:MAG: outer membrane protein assembly factor BamB family protein [Planctomycetota bacterium]|jgi:outer membrane protein assembly factor BamB